MAFEMGRRAIVSPANRYACGQVKDANRSVYDHSRYGPDSGTVFPWWSGVCGEAQIPSNESGKGIYDKEGAGEKM